MAETGSVGGPGGGPGGSSGASSGSSANDNDANSSSSVDSSSSHDSQTTAESIANSPTTADTLSGGDAARSDSANANSANNKDPEPGTGSMDAAAGSSNNTAAQDAASRAQQTAITPDTPAPVFDPDASNPNSSPGTNPNLGVKTSESLTSTASMVGTVVEGGLNAIGNQVDRTGRAQAAATLTNGNAGRLPATGYANRADLAATLTDAKLNTTTALSASPFGPNAVSTQQLTTAARSTNTLSRAAGIAGTVVGPVVAGYEGYQSAPADSTTGERVANMLGGGLKEVDDSAVSALAGGVTAAGTVFAGGLVSAGGVTAPAGAAIIASAPATGTAAAIGATQAYDGTGVDYTYDNFIDNTVEPVIATAVDGAIGAYDTASSAWGNLADRVRSWF